MGKDTKIAWCDHTFNCWWGCTKVSPECAHCYAESLDKRVGGSHWGVGSERRFFGEKHWKEPLKWNKEAKDSGERHRVFCASMADVFEDYGSKLIDNHLSIAPLDNERARLWALIEATPDLDWLLLTKRPQNIMTMIPQSWRKKLPFNVWCGTSAGTQSSADKNISELLKVPTIVRFVSMEPLLESVNIAPYLLSNYLTRCPSSPAALMGVLSWVVVGGESGGNARPMHPDWARSIRDQCTAAGVSFFFKQQGEYGPFTKETDLSSKRIAVHSRVPMDEPISMFRVGVKAAGVELEGREWSEVPNPKVEEW